MKQLFLFLLLSLSLFADPAISANDPSTIVEGVSVIKGLLYESAEDYTVQGAQPIAFRRSFISHAQNCAAGYMGHYGDHLVNYHDPHLIAVRIGMKRVC